MTIEGLSDIGADTGSGADELIGENAFSFGRLDFIAYFYNFPKQRILILKEEDCPCLYPVPYLFLIPYSFLLSKNPKQRAEVSEEGIMNKNR